MTESNSDLLFTFSTRNYQAWGLLVVVLCVGLTLFGATIPSIPLSSFFLTIAGALCGVMMIFAGRTQQVSSAEFYEDIFHMRGRDLKKEEYSYSEIKDVTIVKGLWSSAFLTMIITTSDNQDEESEKLLTITKDPINDKLDTDLYTWLKEKIGRSADDTVSET